MPVIVVSKKQYEQIKIDKEWKKVQTPLGKSNVKNSLFTDRRINLLHKKLK